ncbi:MAG: hypothetical protein WC025_03195 [Candidatus Magasanikbacteria bacterium]
MQKKIFLILVFIFLFIPKPSLAILDQRCWLQDDCKKFREDFGSADAVDGFYSASKHEDAKTACKTGPDGKDFTGREIGFCLPAGQSVTGISFGGRTKFSNIGDFIKFIYQYAFIIGSVVAVMVIIVAGVMYIFSGGNSDTVGKAKKKIYGSITGLILMAVSFTILNTINPYLVNLRLPGIWAINTSGIAPVKCESLDEGASLALAKLATSPSPLPLEGVKFSKFTSSTPTICGNDYYVDKTNGQICGGNSCEGTGQTCYQKISDENRACHPANVAGIVYSSSLLTNFVQGNSLASLGSTLFAEGWEWKWITDDGGGDIEMYAVCKNGEHTSISNNSNDPTNDIYKNEEKLTQEYFMNIPLSNLNTTYCSGENGGLKGFVLFLSLNEEGNNNNDEHFIGINKKTGITVDLGDEDQTNNKEIFSKNIVDQYLITLEDLKKGIYIPINTDNICDIDENFEDSLRCYASIGLTKKR